MHANNLLLPYDDNRRTFDDSQYNQRQIFVVKQFLLLLPHVPLT